MKSTLFTIIFISFGFILYGQVGIGTVTPNANAVLDVTSNSQGVLLPRLNTAERDAIVNPAKGLMIFQTDLNCIQVNTGTASTPHWECFDRSVNIGTVFDYNFGTTRFSDFNTQLTNASNYGTNGIYNSISKFNINSISQTVLTTMTTAELLDSYDVISISYGFLTTAEANGLLAYANAGGLVIGLFDSGYNSALNIAFGGTSVGSSGPTSMSTNTNSILNGVFGDGRSVTLSGAGTYGLFTSASIPLGSTVLATNGSNMGIWTRDYGSGRALFFWDEGPFRNSNVSGNDINNSHEIVLHNLIAYLLDKKYK